MFGFDTETDSNDSDSTKKIYHTMWYLLLDL